MKVLRKSALLLFLSRNKKYSEVSLHPLMSCKARDAKEELAKTGVAFSGQETPPLTAKPKLKLSTTSYAH